MLTVNSEDRARIAPLFADMEDTMIRSCLQGRMGRRMLTPCLPPARRSSLGISPSWPGTSRLLVRRSWSVISPGICW